MLNAFDTALQIVHDALTRIQETGGGELRASNDSLARLAAAKGTNPPRIAGPAPGGRIIARDVENPLPFALCPQPSSGLAADSPVGARSPGVPGKAERMAALRARALVCEKCPHLVKSRTQVVFGVGNIDTELMFVGEAPGADEDSQGEPFVGKAGQLLTKIIGTMGFPRGEVYIGNVLKCRPDMPSGDSGNRKPRADEMATCLPYLIEQIEIIRPRVMVALGATAMAGLLGATEPMGELRGRWHEFKGIPLMATYHPAYLLRNQSLAEKRKVWEDMLLVLEKLGKPISEKQRNYFLPKSGS